MSLTTIIIDDESLARERVRGFLNLHSDLEIVAEADNGLSALEAIRTHHPDIIFLDIQMPEMDGFTLLAELSPEERPVIIFTTAYDEYAIKAFEVHAIDYLLKPFGKDRFNEAVERAKKQCGPSSQLDNQLELLLSKLPAANQPQETPALTRITIKEQGRMYFIDLNQIIWIEAAGNYAEIHDSERTHLLRETMTHLEKRLPAKDFIRINRSAIVRIGAILDIRAYARGEHYVSLTSGAKVKSTIPLRELQEKLESA